MSLKSRTKCFFGDKILHLGSDFRKLGSIAVLRSLIRILRASLALIDTEMAEKYAKLAEIYAKLGKAAKLRSIIRYRRKESGFCIRTMIRIRLKS